MNELLEQALHIRYSKFYFTITFLEDGILPEHKASAFRGGIGEMMLRANCIRDRKCEICDFRGECVVQRTLYSQFETKPDYVTSGDSIGYVLFCSDHRTDIQAGDTMELSITLFGKSIVYFNQFLQGLYALGMQGIGKDYLRFQVTGIEGAGKRKIMDGNNIYMQNYRVEYLDEYVKKRMEYLQSDSYQIIFYSPVSIKYDGVLQNSFSADAMRASVLRRIFLMECFEGIEESIYDLVEESNFRLSARECRRQTIMRYSNRKNSKMPLRGIVGSAFIEDSEQKMLPFLLAGEILHIGKNTSFGFGKYRLKTGE